MYLLIRKKRFSIVLLIFMICLMLQPLSTHVHASNYGENAEAHSIAWSNDISDWLLDETSSMLYVISNNSDYLYIIDTDTMTVEQQLPIGATPNAMSRYEDILFIALSGEPKIARVDLSNQTVLEPINVRDNAYYVSATSTHLLYSTVDSTLSYQFSTDTSKILLGGKGKTSLLADESTNSVYIGSPFWSKSDLTVFNYVENVKIDESRTFDGNHFYYPNEYMFADDNYVYFAGSKIDKSNVKRVYGTYPASKGPNYYHAQISIVNDRYVLTHEAVFEKETLKKISDFPYSTTRALVSNDNTFFFYNKQNAVIEKYYLLQDEAEVLTLYESGGNFLQASHSITDFQTNNTTPYLFVISEETNDLVILDKATNQVVNTVLMGSKPTDIELLNDTIYIAFSGENNIGMITIADSLQPGATISRLPTLEYPYRIAPFTDQIFYTGDDQHQPVRALNVTAGTEKQYISFYYPSLFADQINQIIYVADTNTTSSKVRSFSIADQSLKSIAQSPSDHSRYVNQRYVHVDGEQVYYGHERFNAESLTLLSTYPEQIIYAKNEWSFGMNAVYDSNTASKITDLPFIALHVHVNDDNSIYISTNKRLYYFNDMDSLINYSQNGGMASAPILYDTDEAVNIINGYIYFQSAADNEMIESYNIYFADVQGNKVSKIENAYDAHLIQDGMYRYPIINPIEIPVGAVKIGIAPIIKGNFSDSGGLTLGTLWDSPTYLVQDVVITDNDNRVDYLAGSITWNPAINESLGKEYLIYFTDGEKLLGDPIRTVPTGSLAYAETFDETVIPSSAKGVAIILIDSVGNSGPYFKPLIFIEKISAPIKFTDVTIVNNSVTPDQITVNGVSIGDEIWVYPYGSNQYLGWTLVSTPQNSVTLSISNLGNQGDKIVLYRKSLDKFRSIPLILSIPDVIDSGGGTTPGGGTPGGGTPGGSTPGGGTPGGSTPGGSTPGGGTPGGGTPGGSTPGGGTPGGSTPGGDIPGGNIPGGDIPGGNIPGGNIPGGNIPGGSIPGGNIPGSNIPGGDEPWETITSTTREGKQLIQLQLLNNSINQLTENEEFKNSNIINIYTKDTADRYEVLISRGVLADVLLLEASTTLKVTTPNGSLQIPVSTLLKEINTTATNPIVVSIEQASTDYTKLLNAQLLNSGIQMLGNPLDFTVSITHNGKTEQINHFSEYINHELIIKSGQIPPDQLAGLTYDPVTKKFVPVPIKTEWKDGFLHVSLYKKGNSIYTVVRTGHKSYKDVEANSIYFESIQALTNRMVLEGFTDGTFKPEQSITRAEFAALLVRSLGILPSDGTATTRFTDVMEGVWYDKAIESSVSAGLITGYTPTTFKPNQTINHQEMIAILVRAYEFVHTLPANQTSVKLPDTLSLPTWFVASYEKAVQIGLLSSDSDTYTFEPVKYATRQESAFLINRLLEVLEFE